MSKGFGPVAVKVSAQGESSRFKEAVRTSPAFKLARDLQDGVWRRAVRLMVGKLDEKGSDARAAIEAVFALDHLMWLEVCSYALASQILEAEDIEEANDWSRYIQSGRRNRGANWFDPPGRWAVAGPTGVGKTVLATSLMAEVAERYQRNGCRVGRGIRGVLYSASSVDLLVDAWHQLQSLGVDMGQVALIYSEEEREPVGIDSVKGKDLGLYPLVLCTQQRIQELSTGNNRKIGQRDFQSLLQQLMSFQGKERCGIWDEAFHSADVAALTHKQIATAAAVIRTNELLDLAEEEGRADVAKAAEQLLGVHRRLAAVRSGVSRSPIRNRTGRSMDVELIEASGFQWLADELRDGHPDASNTLEIFRDMSASALQVFSIPPVVANGKITHLVQPVARVDPMLKRVLVLDASYRISVLSASDRTVKESSRLTCADVAGKGSRLLPKLFDRVVVNLCRGPSGRGGMESDRKKRQGMIQRQVSRILRLVPEGEPFLICTFKDRERLKRKNGRQLKTIQWIEEIKTELARQGVANWEERASFVTWGMHKGRNCWRHIKYGFAFGVTQRSWAGDLHLKAKVLEGDLVNVSRTLVPNAQGEGVSAEIAADLQQLIGRLFCRNTTRVEGLTAGQSGETTFWLEIFEQRTSRELALGGPIPTRLREVMPGIRFVVGEDGEAVSEVKPEVKAIKPSMEQQFMAAALAWVAKQQGDQLNTADLTAAVRTECSDVLATVNPKTLSRGIAKAKQQLVAGGEWEATTSRILARRPR